MSSPRAARPDRSRRSERAGFTIIEAVVLISIVGIMGAVAAPRFLVMSEMDATHAHREALGDLRFAQRLAANSGCPVQVDFDSAGYVLTQRTGCRSGSYTQELIDPSSNQAPFAVTLPAGVSASSTVDPLVFDALGRVTTTGGIVSDATITLGTQSLQAIGETGLVRVP